MGRCEPTTGIEPFGRLIHQVLAEEPYRSGERLFWIVDNGSSHRGEAAKKRLRQADSRIILVHTPVHASWLNQVEIYFSIIQRKVLTPNDFADLEAIRLRLALYEALSNQSPRPFQWKFDRTKLAALLAKIEARQMALADTQLHCLVQIRRSLFAMDHSCNHEGYEAPNVCWSLAKRRTTASGERPSLARRFRVATMPDPSRQCSWRATVADRSAPRVHAANRSQYDPCVLGRRDALLTSSRVETQDGRADAGRSQARTASSDLA
jgi:hypothetical protein